MLRSACAALALALVVLAWPAFAQSDKDDDEGATAEATTGAAKDESSEEAAEPEAEEAKPEDYSKPGFYMGLAGSWAIEEFDNADNIDVKDAVGFNARFGYKALSWLAGEGEVEYLPKFDIDWGSQDSNLEVWCVGGNLRLNLPTDLIQPYFILGGGYMSANMHGDGLHEDHGFDGKGGFARVGAGIEFYPWVHFGIDVGLSYVIPAGDIDNDNFLSVNFGGLYKF
jgi:hypothetical protein